MAKKTTTYNRILKEFTKINNKLPEDRKLSIKQRRKIIKDEILPAYKDVPQYKIRVKKLRDGIYKQLDKLPPKEICDLNYIDASEFAYVEWFSLDETITELVPDCVYIKISAGEYGETKIFNTRNYEYGRNGVRSIVEEIRVDAANTSGKFIFSGYKKLRPRKKNDGTPENYFLDFVLIIISKKGVQEPQGETESVKYDLPKTREVRSKKTKIKTLIEGKIKALKSKRDSKKRAKKTLIKNINLLKAATKRYVKSKKPSKETSKAVTEKFVRASTLLEKYYKEGKLTKYQYDIQLDVILKELNKKK
jgi:hypothetical protein